MKNGKRIRTKVQKKLFPLKNRITAFFKIRTLEKSLNLLEDSRQIGRAHV